MTKLNTARRPADDIEQAVRAGGNFAAAILDRLTGSLESFSQRRGLNRPEVSQFINGRLAPSDRVLKAFVTEFGGSADQWKRLWLIAAGRKMGVSPSSAAAGAVFALLLLVGCNNPTAPERGAPNPSVPAEPFDCSVFPAPPDPCLLPAPTPTPTTLAPRLS